MKLTKLSIIGTLAIITTVLVAPAQATTSYPSAEHPFTPCTSQVTTMCIVTEQADVTHTGDNEIPTWTAPPSEMNVQAYFYYGYDTSTVPSLTFNVLNTNGSGSQQELAPEIPAGSKIRLEFNLGNWNPRVDFSNATAKIIKWDTTKINGQWHLSIDLQTVPFTFALHCTPFSDPWQAQDGTTYDYCEHPQSEIDYSSYAQISLGATDGTDATAPDSSPQAGVWVADNATGGTSPSIDSTTMTISRDYAGPPVKASDGSPNTIFSQTFIPDSVLRASYGIEPSSITGSSNFTVTRTDGSQTSNVQATIKEVDGSFPGILISVPSIVTYVNVSTVAQLISGLSPRNVASPSNFSKSHPNVKIKIRKFEPAKPGVSTIKSKRVNGKFAIITVNPSNFATGIQTKCTKGSRSKVSNDYMSGYAIASIKLTKGTWTCKIRSVRSASGKKLYSSWSKTAKIKIE